MESHASNPPIKVAVSLEFQLAGNLADINKTSDHIIQENVAQILINTLMPYTEIGTTTQLSILVVHGGN